MLQVRITDAGCTNLLVDDVIDRDVWQEEKESKVALAEPEYVRVIDEAAQSLSKVRCTKGRY